MQFNLRHFMAKRQLTVSQWAKDNKIQSVEDYDKLMLNQEFSNDITIRKELEDEFNATKKNGLVELVLNQEGTEVLVTVSTEEPTEKPSKKKRLKDETDPV